MNFGNSNYCITNHDYSESIFTFHRESIMGNLSTIKSHPFDVELWFQIIPLLHQNKLYDNILLVNFYKTKKHLT
jgi:hypothetical protein